MVESIHNKCLHFLHHLHHFGALDNTLKLSSICSTFETIYTICWINIVDTLHNFFETIYNTLETIHSTFDIIHNIFETIYNSFETVDSIIDSRT